MSQVVSDYLSRLMSESLYWGSWHHNKWQLPIYFLGFILISPLLNGKFSLSAPAPTLILRVELNFGWYYWQLVPLLLEDETLPLCFGGQGVGLVRLVVGKGAPMFIFVDEGDEALPFFEVGLGCIHGGKLVSVFYNGKNIRDMLKNIDQIINIPKQNSQKQLFTIRKLQDISIATFRKKHSRQSELFVIFQNQFNLSVHNQTEMQNKSKNTGEVYRDQRHVSPCDLKGKSKRNKQNLGRVLKGNRDVVGSGKVKHMPSKSALETSHGAQNYGASGTGSGQMSGRQSNPFTFTHILQQSRKNVHGLQSSSTQQQSALGASKFYCKEGKVNGKMSGQTPMTIANFTPNSFSIYDDNKASVEEMEFSRILQQKLSNIKSDNCKSFEKSVGKSTSKSPVRMTNVHRLNNTPKIRDNRSKSKNREGKDKSCKTFREMLSPEERTSNREQTNMETETINLECSQKFFKFIKESQSKDKYQKNRSNLLSTGIVNFTQPLDFSESGLNRQSKVSIPSKAQINRIISEENIKQFEEESLPSSGDILLEDKVREIKGKIAYLNTEIMSKIELHNEDTFVGKVSDAYNPELLNRDVTKTIQELSEMNNHFQSSFQGLIKHISMTAQKVYEDISQTIDTLNASKSTMINWIDIEGYLKEKDVLEEFLCRNEVMDLKLCQLQSNINRGVDQLSSLTKDSSGRVLETLREIQKEVSGQFGELSSIWNKKAGKSRQEEGKMLELLGEKLKSVHRFQQEFKEFFHK